MCDAWDLAPLQAGQLSGVEPLGCSVSGPYFNHLIPNSNFSVGARLVTIVTYFTYIRLALPDFAAELQAAIKKARKLPAKPLILAYLLDLRDLLYFPIPVVSLLACCVW